jgi:hypothetical protein
MGGLGAGNSVYTHRLWAQRGKIEPTAPFFFLAPSRN